MTESRAPLDDREPQDPGSGWWITHSNLVALTSWMADHDYSAKDVAYAVEKPWKYTDEFMQATGLTKAPGD